jgi:ATP-dependent DNA ligase
MERDRLSTWTSFLAASVEAAARLLPGDKNAFRDARFIEPTERGRVPKLPEGADWVYEIKQDGYRAIGLVNGNSALFIP